MSRTNHDAKIEHAARKEAEARQYAQQIRDRDANRQFRESIRELNRAVDYWLFDFPLALAAFAK